MNIPMPSSIDNAHEVAPFAVEIPNSLTKETLEKSQRGEDIQTLDSLSDMFASWKT